MLRSSGRNIGKSNIKLLIKSNSGSALIMAILILIVLSLIGSAILTLTVENFKMSIFYDDLNNSYILAENGVEKVIKILDEKVANIQEEARIEASANVQQTIQENPLKVRDTNNDDGSINYNSLETEFDNLYNEIYYQKLNEEFKDISSEDYKKELLGTELVENEIVYTEFEGISGTSSLILAEYNGDEHIVKIQVEGKYEGYRKTLQVRLDMTVDDDKVENGVPFKVSVKEGNNITPVIPNIFYDRAVISEKNIISVDGNLTVNGDVLAFGKIPAVDGNEDMDAPWYKYGGVLAGLTTQITDSDEEFGFDSSRTGYKKAGSITVNGSIATMGYLSSVFGDELFHSDINVTGDVFARAVRAYESSNYSVLNLNNVYTTDNFQIDSNRSTATINGIYFGIVDAGYMIDGTGSSELREEDLYLHKRTSSVVVNGDSNIVFKNKIYIGGSTFITDYIKEGTTNYTYMTGISALKTSYRIPQAYREDGINVIEELSDYKVENPYYENYINEGIGHKMLMGNTTDPGNFPIGKRAEHFKAIWDSLWGSDDLYLSYINTESITVEGEGITDGKLNGYSNGAIVANGKVYGMDDFKDYNPVIFHDAQLTAIEKFHLAINDFVNDSFNSDFPKLDYTTPDEEKQIMNYLDYRFNGENRIVTNLPYVSAQNPTRGFIFYGEGDANITNNGTYYEINGNEIQTDKGIIFVDGNVYVEDGFSLEGIIMATGNIIFLGDSEITYDSDVIVNLLNADVNTKGFFKLLNYDISNTQLERQRIVSRSFDIIEWREM